MPIDLNDPEVKAAIKAAVEESTDGLALKNRELLKELKAARKGSEVDPEVLERAEAERDDALAKLKDANKATIKAQQESKTVTEALTAERAMNDRSFQDREITDWLVKSKVAPPYMDFGRAKFISESRVGEVDGKKVLLFGEKHDKPAETFFTEWSKSEQAKHFQAAPQNNGGGAFGGSGAGGGERGELATIVKQILAAGKPKQTAA